MEAKTVTTTTITLSFNEDEARVLAGMLQNPVCHPDEERPAVKKLRVEVFNTLRDSVSRSQ